jgi:hypothetical protein
MNMDMIFFIVFGVLSRLLPHPANMTAVGSIALFAGAKFDTKKAIIVTMATMLISDIALGLHPLMWATYGSLLLGVCVGKWIGRSVYFGRITGGILTSSIIFFVITNFAVWLTTPLYPKTVSGLAACYMMAIPFFRNSILGDLFYGYTFFFVFAAALGVAGFVRLKLRSTGLRYTTKQAK